MNESKIGKTFFLAEELGDIDAVHVPIVISSFYKPHEVPEEILAGKMVRFENSVKYVSLCDDPLLAHGIIDPFLTVKNTYIYFVVIANPKFVGKLTHNVELTIPNITDKNKTITFEEMEKENIFLKEKIKALENEYNEEEDEKDFHSSCRGCY